MGFTRTQKKIVREKKADKATEKEFGRGRRRRRRRNNRKRKGK